jgi:hypothetical protein
MKLHQQRVADGDQSLARYQEDAKRLDFELESLGLFKKATLWGKEK